MTDASLQPDCERRRKARAESAVWVVQLHGPHRTRELEAALRDWLSVDEINRHEFEGITEVWEDARGIPVGGLPRIAQRNRSTRRWAPAVAAFLVVCAVGVLTAYGIWFANDYQTGVGEQRVVRLADGTLVSLNSDTRIQVGVTQNRRRVTLARGEAYFEVTHNPERPFVVSVGNHDVTALGTTFLVRFDSDRTAVTLVEGKVTVSNVALPLSAQPPEDSSATASRTEVSDGGSAVQPSSSEASRRTTVRQTIGATAGRFLSESSPRQGADNAAGSAQIVTLEPGERLELNRDSTPILDSPRIDAVIAWRRGEVVLEKTSLADAIAEMNRYQNEKIVLDSPDIGQLRISGIYRVGDISGFAQTIANLYHLHVTEQGNEMRLTGKPAADATAIP
jgi:transmembrane sensor